MRKLIAKIKSLDKGTIIRTVLLICAYINQIIAVIGMTSFASSYAYQIITLVITLVMSSITAWENNDFTHFAQLTTKVFNALKDRKLEEEEIQDLIKKAEENIKK